MLQTALNYGLVSLLSSLVAVDITPSRPIGVEVGTKKLKSAIPSGWDTKQFEYNYKEIVAPRLQKISSKNEWYMSSDLMQKSEMYSLPQTAFNWKASLLLALFSMLVGITVLFFFGRKSNA